MRRPIDSASRSTVEYPSAIFSLERHESFPYDRFAYSVFHIGIEAFHHRKLPEQMHVSFFDGARNTDWWKFSARIGALRKSEDHEVSGFQISMSPLAPLMLYGISHFAVNYLFNDDLPSSTTETIRDIRESIERFMLYVDDSLQVYWNDGIASCIRRFIELAQIQFSDVEEFIAMYDLMVKTVVYHEIAHAYVGQLTEFRNLNTAQDLRSFEFIVDTVATNWIYREMIVNTPDSETYRDKFGRDSHRDSIFANAHLVTQSQTLMMLFFAIASRHNNKGRANVGTAATHPQSTVRCLVQRLHFSILLESNFADLIDDEGFRYFERHQMFYDALFTATGFIKDNDWGAVIDDQTAADLRRSEALVAECNIEELKNMTHLFHLFATRRKTNLE